MLDIEFVKEEDNDDTYFFGRDEIHSTETTFKLKNVGTKRLAFKFVTEQDTYGFAVPNEDSCNKFLEPEEECEFIVQTHRLIGKCYVMYEASEKSDLRDCFEQHSFVRQVYFNV